MINRLHKAVTSRLMIMSTAAVITMAAAGCHKTADGTPDLEQLYAEVDEEIGHSHIYETEKNRRIEQLRRNLTRVDNDQSRLVVYDNLISEYQSYVCDSALKYVEEARELAELSGDKHTQMRLMLKKADIASHAGLFTEAHEMLSKVNENELDSALKTAYYSTLCALSQYETEYLPAGEYTFKSREARRNYTDSLMRVADPGSFAYLTNWADETMHEDPGLVKHRLEGELKKYMPGTREYSVIASTLARVYGQTSDINMQKAYLAKTVISDIKGAIKENMAMRELATMVFEEGNIERANLYMKSSLDDATYYAASMSGAQSGRMLPVIDSAYAARQKNQQKHLRSLIAITSFLLAMAITGLIVILRQMRHVKRANKMVHQSNEELSAMSERLQQANDALAETNKELRKSNRTAEEYAGLFMDFCSVTISNLQKYHLTLRTLALQGNVKGILKKLDKGDASSETLKVFYQKFDDAILNLYPNFADKVNELLQPDGRVVLKSGERLNTELRILALMKIGLGDGEQMADFLRCSLSTVYTYRSKLKRRALNPEKFEGEVMSI